MNKREDILWKGILEESKILSFINYYIRFENIETKTIFDRELHFLTKNNKTMGIEELLLEMAKEDGMMEGEIKGEMKSKTEVARNCIENLKYSEEDTAKILDVPLEFIKNIKTQMTAK